MKATKHDKNKLRYDLIPWFGEQELARVFTIGAKKYGDNNWRGGFAFSRIIGAAKRHLAAFIRGEKYDPEDGQLHLSSLAWCAYILMEFEEFSLGTDDRIKYAESSKKSPKRKTVQKMQESIATPKARKRRPRRASKRFILR